MRLYWQPVALSEELARTEYGQRIVALRRIDGEGNDGNATHVRISARPTTATRS
ncbi:hypothetical protein [Streptomyces scopuliridis]|uniref:hypothetical protein n=1 Tax=Streptomyces scopuliridis TaxID=452529 RepID=UPI00342040D9